MSIHGLLTEGIVFCKKYQKIFIKEGRINKVRMKPGCDGDNHVDSAVQQQFNKLLFVTVGKLNLHAWIQPCVVRDNVRDEEPASLGSDPDFQEAGIVLVNFSVLYLKIIADFENLPAGLQEEFTFVGWCEL